MAGTDQERADFFYGLMRSGQWGALAERSAEEVRSLLGPPSEVWELDHEGHRWTRIVYRFDSPPSQATEEEKAAIRKGMRFTPTLLFRDGIGVSSDRFNDEVLGGQKTAGPPAGIEWRRGESFP